MKLKRILMLCVAVCATGPVLGMTGPVEAGAIRRAREALLSEKEEASQKEGYKAPENLESLVSQAFKRAIDGDAGYAEYEGDAGYAEYEGEESVDENTQFLKGIARDSTTLLKKSDFVYYLGKCNLELCSFGLAEEIASDDRLVTGFFRGVNARLDARESEAVAQYIRVILNLFFQRNHPDDGALFAFVDGIKSVSESKKPWVLRAVFGDLCLDNSQLVSGEGDWSSQDNRKEKQFALFLAKQMGPDGDMTSAITAAFSPIEETLEGEDGYLIDDDFSMQGHDDSRRNVQAALDLLPKLNHSWPLTVNDSTHVFGGEDSLLKGVEFSSEQADFIRYLQTGQGRPTNLQNSLLILPPHAFVVDGQNLLEDKVALRLLIADQEIESFIAKGLGWPRLVRQVLLHGGDLTQEPFKGFLIRDRGRFLLWDEDLQEGDPAIQKLVEFWSSASDISDAERFSFVSELSNNVTASGKIVVDALHAHCLHLAETSGEVPPIIKNINFELEQIGRPEVRKVFSSFVPYLKIDDNQVLLDTLKADAKQQRLLNQSSWFTSFKQQHLTPSRQKMAWGIGAGVGLTAVLAQILHAVKDKDELVATYIKRKLGYKNLRKLSRTEEARARRRVVGLLLSFLVTGVAGYKYYQHSGGEVKTPERPGRGAL